MLRVVHILKRQIKSEPTRPEEDNRDCNDQQKEIVVYTVGKESAITNLVPDLDYQNNHVDQCRQLGKEADDEKQGN